VAFSITHRSGEMEADVPLDAIEDLIAELASSDPDHPDIAVGHESGWGLSAFPSGLVLWGNVDSDDAERRMLVSRERLLELMRAVAEGDLAELERQPWEPVG
jgi:hypothetical protein